MTAAEAGDTPILEKLLQEREDRELFPPVSGDLAEALQEPPTVEFAVKPPRFSRRWWRENLTWRRQVAGGLSGLVLLATAWGWWQ